MCCAFAWNVLCFCMKCAVLLLEMWFSISCYPTNTLSPSLEILHVSPQLPVPVYMQSRRCHLPDCQCKGHHFILSGSALDLTINDSQRQTQIEKCQYFSRKSNSSQIWDKNNDKNNNNNNNNNKSKSISKVLTLRIFWTLLWVSIDSELRIIICQSMDLFWVFLRCTHTWGQGLWVLSVLSNCWQMTVV